MAGAEFAPGPTRSKKVLDLDGYGDCNQNDQVRLFLMFPTCINALLQPMHPMRAHRWNPSVTLDLVSP